MKSPFAPKSEYEGKENHLRDESINRREPIFDLKNQSLKTRDPLKTLEREVTELYDLKQMRLEENVQRFKKNMIEKRRRREEAMMMGANYRSYSPIRGRQERHQTSPTRGGEQSLDRDTRENSQSKARSCFSPLIIRVDSDQNRKQEGFKV